MSDLRVLVAEDDPEIGRLLDVVLSGLGHLATITATSDDALATFRAAQFDVAVLDVMMPGSLDGFELCREVRRGFDGVVVLLTARTSEDDHVAGYEAGADAYVTKPFRPRDLASTIAELTATSPTERARRRSEERRKATFLRSLEHRF